jgi:uncharacterized protein YcfL
MTLPRSIFLILLILVGCSKPIEIVVSRVARLPFVFEDPKPITARSVEYKVFVDSKDAVWISMSPESYKNFSLNMDDIKRFSEEQSAIVRACKSYYNIGYRP